MDGASTGATGGEASPSFHLLAPAGTLDLTPIFGSI
jgi:hypothetical protein